MCQLCFISFNNTDKNASFLLNQLRLNASVGHKDGCGFFTEPNGIWKSELSADAIGNLGRIIRSQVTDNPIISHVRKATLTNNVKIKTADKSHPFETEKLIFAHNGHLDRKVNSYDKELQGLIDSEIFLKYLDNAFTGENLHEAITSTMEKFTGKFAFLLYDKINKKYYVVRGNSATLFYIVYDGGIVINTEKESLIRGLNDYINNMQLYPFIFSKQEVPDPVRYTLDEIKEIPIESMLEIRGTELIPIGKVKENSKPWASNYAWEGNSRNQYNLWGGLSNKAMLNNSNVTKITNFMREYSVDIYYMDAICYVVLGRGILELDGDDVSMLADEIIPYIIKKTKKHFIREWKRIRDASLGVLPTELNIKTGLNFPYVFDEISNLRSVAFEIEEEKKCTTF